MCMAQAPLEYVESLMEHYPDLCARINQLDGIENLVEGLAADQAEYVRAEHTISAACRDFQARMAELGMLNAQGKLSNEQTHEAMAYALKMALNNAFGLGVWLGESRLARFPKACGPLKGAT